MQSKISSFFKPFSSSSSTKFDQVSLSICDDGEGDGDLPLWENSQHQFVNTYKRRASKLDNGLKSAEASEGQASDALTKSISKEKHLKPESISSGKVLNKKRSYAQFHLDLGQSDFSLRACNICGVTYAPGEEKDEKEHRSFHKNYTQGVHFKGFQNENVVHKACNEGGRIVLVLDSDPISLRNKVKEIIKMMEIELGDGWIFHELCQVYLFISSRRVAGCLVAEPIEEAFRVVPSSVDKRSDSISKTKSKSNTTTLQFGEIILHREVMKKVSTVNSVEVINRNHSGAIVCEEEAAPAVCGVRAIWVAPSNRRKHIASQLLDAARRSFNAGISQIAFSPPTCGGKALATGYTGAASFMVYNPQALSSCDAPVFQRCIE